MQPSKRFVITSFFAALTLAALCANLYSNISDDAKTTWFSDRTCSLIFSISLLLFLIKFFIDDVVDNKFNPKEPVTRKRLATLILGWTFFLFTALFLNRVIFPSVFWFIGLFFITRFLYMTQSLIPDYWKTFSMQNCNLLLLLWLLLGAETVLPSIYLKTLFSLLLFAYNGYIFIALLKDDSVPS